MLDANETLAIGYRYRIYFAIQVIADVAARTDGEFDAIDFPRVRAALDDCYEALAQLELLEAPDPE